MRDFTNRHDSVLRATETENGGGSGAPPAAAAADPNAAPDLTKLFEQLTLQMNNRLDGLDRKFSESNSNLDKRLNNVLTDITEVLAAPTPQLTVTPPAAASPNQQTPAPVAAPPPSDETGLQKVILTRRLKDMEELNRNTIQRLEETQREMQQTKIEAAIAQGMASKAWADQVVIDMVARQMAQMAAIDPTDGKVKINGADPKKHIETFWQASLWAQPPLTNSGSGNTGAQRRPDGSVDLASYNAAKASPEDLNKLIEQTKRSVGM